MASPLPSPSNLRKYSRHLFAARCGNVVTTWDAPASHEQQNNDDEEYTELQGVSRHSWSLQEQLQQEEQSEQSGELSDMRSSANGQVLAVSSAHRIDLLHTKTLRCLSTLAIKPHTNFNEKEETSGGNVSSVSFDKSMRYLCTSSKLGYASVYDLQQQPQAHHHSENRNEGRIDEPIRQFHPFPNGTCTRARFDPTTTVLAALGADNDATHCGNPASTPPLKLYHIKSGRWLSTLQWYSHDETTLQTSPRPQSTPHPNTNPGAFDFSLHFPNRCTVASSLSNSRNQDACVMLWDIAVATGVGDDASRGQSNASCSSGSSQSSSNRRRAATTSPLVVLRGVHTDAITEVAFSPLTSSLIASSSLDGTIAFHDMNHARTVQVLRAPRPSAENVRGGVTAMSLHSDGYTCLVGTSYGQAHVYDLRKIEGNPRAHASHTHTYSRRGSMDVQVPMLWNAPLYSVHVDPSGQNMVQNVEFPGWSDKSKTRTKSKSKSKAKTRPEGGDNMMTPVKSPSHNNYNKTAATTTKARRRRNKQQLDEDNKGRNPVTTPSTERGTRATATTAAMTSHTKHGYPMNKSPRTPVVVEVHPPSFDWEHLNDHQEQQPERKEGEGNHSEAATPTGPAGMLSPMEPSTMSPMFFSPSPIHHKNVGNGGVTGDTNETPLPNSQPRSERKSVQEVKEETKTSDKVIALQEPSLSQEILPQAPKTAIQQHQKQLTTTTNNNNNPILATTTTTTSKGPGGVSTTSTMTLSPPSSPGMGKIQSTTTYTMHSPKRNSGRSPEGGVAEASATTTTAVELSPVRVQDGARRRRMRNYELKSPVTTVVSSSPRASSSTLLTDSATTPQLVVQNTSNSPSMIARTATPTGAGEPTPALSSTVTISTPFSPSTTKTSTTPPTPNVQQVESTTHYMLSPSKPSSSPQQPLHPTSMTTTTTTLQTPKTLKKKKKPHFLLPTTSTKIREKQLAATRSKEAGFGGKKVVTPTRRRMLMEAKGTVVKPHWEVTTTTATANSPCLSPLMVAVKEKQGEVRKEKGGDDAQEVIPQVSVVSTTTVTSPTRKQAASPRPRSLLDISQHGAADRNTTNDNNTSTTWNQQTTVRLAAPMSQPSSSSPTRRPQSRLEDGAKGTLLWDTNTIDEGVKSPVRTRSIKSPSAVKLDTTRPSLGASTRPPLSPRLKSNLKSPSSLLSHDRKEKDGSSMDDLKLPTMLRGQPVRTPLDSRVGDSRPEASTSNGGRAPSNQATHATKAEHRPRNFLSPRSTTFSDATSPKARKTRDQVETRVNAPPSEKKLSQESPTALKKEKESQRKQTTLQQNVNRREKLDNKTATAETPISPDFVVMHKTELSEMMQAMTKQVRDEVKVSITNMHIDMLKQFQVLSDDIQKYRHEPVQHVSQPLTSSAALKRVPSSPSSTSSDSSSSTSLLVDYEEERTRQERDNSFESQEMHLGDGGKSEEEAGKLLQLIRENQALQEQMEQLKRVC